LASKRTRTSTDTRTMLAYLGHRNIQPGEVVRLKVRRVVHSVHWV
jgi:hypothetical protein